MVSKIQNNNGFPNHYYKNKSRKPSELDGSIKLTTWISDPLQYTSEDASNPRETHRAGEQMLYRENFLSREQNSPKNSNLRAVPKPLGNLPGGARSSEVRKAEKNGQFTNRNVNDSLKIDNYAQKQDDRVQHSHLQQHHSGGGFEQLDEQDDLQDNRGEQSRKVKNNVVPHQTPARIGLPLAAGWGANIPKAPKNFARINSISTHKSRSAEFRSRKPYDRPARRTELKIKGAIIGRENVNYEQNIKKEAEYKALCKQLLMSVREQRNLEKAREAQQCQVPVELYEYQDEDVEMLDVDCYTGEFQGGLLMQHGEFEAAQETQFYQTPSAQLHAAALMPQDLDEWNYIAV